MAVTEEEIFTEKILLSAKLCIIYMLYLYIYYIYVLYILSNSITGLRVSGVWGSRILRQSGHEVSKVVSPTHLQSLPPGNIPGTHFC
jgi:hypothetical protein